MMMGSIWRHNGSGSALRDAAEAKTPDVAGSAIRQHVERSVEPRLTAFDEQQRAAYIENRDRMVATAIERAKNAVPPGVPMDPNVAAALASRARQNALRAQGSAGAEKALLEAAYEAGLSAKARLEQILAAEAADAAALEQENARLADIKAAKLTTRVAALFSRKRSG